MEYGNVLKCTIESTNRKNTNCTGYYLPPSQNPIKGGTELSSYTWTLYTLDSGRTQVIIPKTVTTSPYMGHLRGHSLTDGTVGHLGPFPKG